MSADKGTWGRHYTDAQKSERRRLLEIISAEEIAYRKRVEPYYELLGRIEAMATPFFIPPAPRSDD